MGNRNEILNKQSVNLKNRRKNDHKNFDTDDRATGIRRKLKSK